MPKRAARMLALRGAEPRAFGKGKDGRRCLADGGVRGKYPLAVGPPARGLRLHAMRATLIVFANGRANPEGSSASIGPGPNADAGGKPSTHAREPSTEVDFRGRAVAKPAVGGQLPAHLLAEPSDDQ